MGERRNTGETVKLAREELARLREQTAEPLPLDKPLARRATGSQPPLTVAGDDGPARARSDTLHDPMTMALLAEVARNTPSPEPDATDVDPSAIATPALADGSHPHVKRR